MTLPMPPAVLEVVNAAVRFGEVRALDGVSLSIHPGECIGLVGHNGAGKSTIVSVINGGLSPQQGEVFSDGTRLAPYGIGVARSRGVRCVFQELSLCPNLSIIENTRIMHRNLGGFGWRKRAAAIILASIDAIFPDHGIDVGGPVGTLSIAQRQMVEIAMAFSDAGQPPRLVILDEPTSSLDAGLAAQLLAHVRRFVANGGAVILISHMLTEILETASRIVVMKDGKIVAERGAGGFDHASLVEAMGSATTHQTAARRAPAANQPVLELTLPKGQPFRACQGEVVGLAGLGGHGQTRLLLALFDRHSPKWWPIRNPAVTFVAGDRRENGIFDLWSILKNMTAASLGDLSRRGFVQDKAEIDRGDEWKARIDIRTPDMNNPILSLSGGNQQKVLFARALSTRAPVVLMDDPMRGVDVGTKHEVYGMIRAEAEAGRTFVWYSTEMEEMQLCDRVYVFREGAIVAELTGDAISEHNILRASFEGEAA
ncbi:sugar ABC transporter ATP-binding protein [Pseudotabrizicola sp.]|uniref:sugar ABC transporter ATP-binding protein n=1 Tax=Pseudotabrizicola sp. TaxID=2939647 RepID=UPI002726E8B4|nr:sugar ABC transporter ATP-binding protein [Pseudotabrizicola sp.]MDO8884193.1 sugar ABC transporter ATP-binding protein [Pseudotabrizicola sp.]